MNQNKTIKCAYCGKVIVDDFFALEIDGEHYCSHFCACDAGYEKCEFCGEWTHFDFAISIFIDDNYCGSFCDNDCAEHAGYSECNQCGEWHLADSMYSVDNYKLCQSCFFEIAGTCDNCGEAHLLEHLSYSDCNGEYYCEDCYADCAHHPALHNYGYTPDLNFYGDASNYPYLGIELETDCGNDIDGYVEAIDSEFEEFVYMTKDGSLTCKGVEITSHPMTLKYHIESEMWERIRAIANEHDYTSHNNGKCGLHIHISRDYFGDDFNEQCSGGYKMMRLLQRFEAEFTRFSRRTSDTWCHYNSYAGNLEAESSKSLADKARKFNADKTHSRALNFQHDATFEIRIFRGTLNIETLYASMALAEGLAIFVKFNDEEMIESVSFAELCEQISASVSSPKASECFKSYLIRRGL